MIYAQYNSTANNAFAMDNGSWWVNNAGDSSQSGNAYVGGQVTANYDEVLGTAYGSANIGGGCSPHGSIAASANGSGQVLACQGGSWQAMGGTSFNVGTTGSASSNIGQAWNLGIWALCYLMGSAWT